MNHLKSVKMQCVFSRIVFRIVKHLSHDFLLTLREEGRLWVFESRVLRLIFGPRRDEVTR